MNNAIVVLSGTPRARLRFNKVARKSCFVKNVNAGNRFSKNGLEGEEINALGSIEDFLQDDSEEIMVSVREGVKTFSRALLVLHWISCELTEKLKESSGIIQLHVTSRNLPTNVEHHDFVLYEDDLNFESEVQRVIDILTKTNPKNQTENSNNQIDNQTTNNNQTNNNKQMEEI
jgi:hypothetical protein